MTWRPIETAPHDGTEILVNSGIGIRIVRWREDRGPWGPGWCTGFGLVKDTAIVCASTMTRWHPIPEFSGADEVAP